ncbi:MAG: SsrA-binding protein SmpB [Patescibacteria group bacterium]
MTTFVQNKKAHFNYDIKKAYEAGIELFGFEVKSVKAHQGSLEGAYVLIRGGEAYLTGATIPPFQMNNTPKGYEPGRNRRLLLKKSEIKELADIETGKGLTVVPISMYNNKGKVKIEIGIARGKKRFDKRQTIKKRDSDREIRRTLKNQ